MKAQAERMKIARRALWQLILDISEMSLFHKKGSSCCSISQGNCQNCCHLVSLLRPGVSMGGHVQHHLLRIPFHYHPLKGFIHKPKATESQKIDLMK